MTLDLWIGEEDAKPDYGPTSVYRLFGASGELLYVGITRRGQRRVNEHAKDKPWWTEVATATFQHFPTWPEAVTAEAHAIKDEKPVYNIVQPWDAPPPHRFVKGTRQRGRGEIGPMIPDDEIRGLLNRQTKKHFGMTAEEFIPLWEAGEIPQDDPRLRYVANLLATVRVVDS